MKSLFMFVFQDVHIQNKNCFMMFLLCANILLCNYLYTWNLKAVDRITTSAQFKRDCRTTIRNIDIFLIFVYFEDFVVNFCIYRYRYRKMYHYNEMWYHRLAKKTTIHNRTNWTNGCKHTTFVFLTNGKLLKNPMENKKWQWRNNYRRKVYIKSKPLNNWLY